MHIIIAKQPQGNNIQIPYEIRIERILFNRSNRKIIMKIILISSSFTGIWYYMVFIDQAPSKRKRKVAKP